MHNFRSKIFKKLIQLTWLGIITFVFSVIAGTTLYVFAAFTEPTAGPATSNQDFTKNILGANNADNDFDSSLVAANFDGAIIERLEYIGSEYCDSIWQDCYGRGWVASTTDDNATTSLTQATCESASNWEWFEDGNGDGDTTDPEDGICVKTSTVMSSTWNGGSLSDNSYIAAYTCSGSFPTGTVATGPTNCALCVADCYDGRKDLPDQGSYTAPDTTAGTGRYGPITPEVLKNWKGTRLPTFVDFFGYCGASTGDADDTAGDGLYYSSGASSDATLGNEGQNVGRGATAYDEYLDLSNGSYEYFSEQHNTYEARTAGFGACSFADAEWTKNGELFRAVFRP